MNLSERGDEYFLVTSVQAHTCTAKRPFYRDVAVGTAVSSGASYWRPR